MASITIRPALPTDEAAWTDLWRGYCDFYAATVPDAVTRRTWSRILDPDASVMCIVAELRGQSDSEVVKRLIAVADSRFQDELVAQAKVNGKLEASYTVPECYRNNLPEALEHTLHPWLTAGLLPDYPFGTDLTDDELRMVRAMQKIKHASQHPTELLTMAVKSLWEGREAPPAYLERLGLKEAHSFKDLLIRRLFSGNV